MKEIVLTKNKVTLVDDEDFEFLSQWKWCISQTGSKMYAARSEQTPSGRRKLIYMHRVILRATESKVDHIDGNGLNNQRSNLRMVTHQQNLCNQRIQDREKSSQYKGVYWDAIRGSWTVQIKENGKPRVVSGIASEFVAARIYDLLALDRFGEYAHPNCADSSDFLNTRTTAPIPVNALRTALEDYGSLVRELGIVSNRADAILSDDSMKRDLVKAAAESIEVNQDDAVGGYTESWLEPEALAADHSEDNVREAATALSDKEAR